MPTSGEYIFLLILAFITVLGLSIWLSRAVFSIGRQVRQKDRDFDLQCLIAESMGVDPAKIQEVKDNYKDFNSLEEHRIREKNRDNEIHRRLQAENA